MFYNPPSTVKPEWRHIHEERCFDFSGYTESDILKDELEQICHDPYETDFSNIEIDVSDDLLEMLIRRTARYLKDKVMPCSFDIWQQKCGDVSEVVDLQTLFGECLVNDQLVEAIVAGCEAETGWRVEPYYMPATV